jgi:hypothetical protein
MKYAFEIASCGMIYVPSFINIGSDIQELIGGDAQTYRRTNTQTHTDSRVIL